MDSFHGGIFVYSGSIVQGLFDTIDLTVRIISEMLQWSLIVEIVYNNPTVQRIHGRGILPPIPIIVYSAFLYVQGNCCCVTVAACAHIIFFFSPLLIIGSNPV